MAKRYIKDAMERIAAKEQMTFGLPEQQDENSVKKPVKTRPKITYWICLKGHVFEHKYRIQNEKLIDDIRCPICGAKIRNKTSEATYKYYLEKTGRADAKEIRMAKLASERKHLKNKQHLDEDEDRCGWN